MSLPLRYFSPLIYERGVVSLNLIDLDKRNSLYTNKVWRAFTTDTFWRSGSSLLQQHSINNNTKVNPNTLLYVMAKIQLVKLFSLLFNTSKTSASIIVKV